LDAQPPLLSEEGTTFRSCACRPDRLLHFVYLRRERLDVDERVAVLVAEPKAGERARLLNFHVPDVGFMRKQILGEFSGLRIQTQSDVIIHASSPRISLVVELRVIRTSPL